MGDRRWTVVLLTLLTVLAGCSMPYGGEDIGREGGYGATDELDITTANGLNDSEREAVVYRTMARVESIRELEFKQSVPIRVISRSEYRNESQQFGFVSKERGEWTEQVWEALFLVSEQTTAGDAVSGVYSGAVLGYYTDGKIVIVGEIDPYTLAHELTHALQAQQLTLNANTNTHNARLAANGLIEGDANTVEVAYKKQCETNPEWSCLSQTETTGATDHNHGVYTAVSMPYTEGPAFVETLYERGGKNWEAVNHAYDAFPLSTEQIIHPARYPDDRPETLRVENRSADGWQRFNTTPQAETMGESSIYTMFAANGVIERRETGNYSHRLSAGWSGDRLVPYHNGGQNGYVWKTTWETKQDAKQFADGYKQLLQRHNASETDGVFVVPDTSPFADAFDVRHTGRTVTIVNAPTPEELDRIHPA